MFLGGTGYFIFLFEVPEGKEKAEGLLSGRHYIILDLI